MRSADPDPTSLPGPLLEWFAGNARDLPWRGVDDPYRIWISEVMLQQTQVETVLRYYDRFLARFPDVSTLASADEADVLAAWSGLGFYRRARNLHRAARIVVGEHGGTLPRSPRVLGELPGLGRYTVGAVLSIAHDARLPILDGNVKRVLARVFRVAGDPTSTPVVRRLWELADAILPERRCGDFNESLMELGATVCRPKGPGCDVCPLARLCAGRRAGDAEEFPGSSRKGDVPRVERVAIYLVRPDGRFLLEQRPSVGLLASMWELPSEDVERGEEPLDVAGRVARQRGARGRPTLSGAVEHRFSHRHWTIRVFELRTRAKAALGRGTWIVEDELRGYGVPSVTRKALRVATASEA